MDKHGKKKRPQATIMLKIALCLFLYPSHINILNSSSLQPEIKKLTLLFIGDIMGHDEQIWSALNRNDYTYSFDTVFTFIRPVIEKADAAVANFEVTLGGLPYSGYPSFSSPEALVTACKNAGIDCLVTANNHAADRKEYGIKNTIRILDSLGIWHTGTFSDRSEKDKRYPLMLKKNGITVALLNYTYGTNGIMLKDPSMVNLIDAELIKEDILKAKSAKADMIAVFLHWGKEYDTIPSDKQYDLEKLLFEAGADMVIGSHPHVIQKMVWNKNANSGKGRITAYSLGNFVSNQRRNKTDGGAIVKIELTKKGPDTFITGADYYLTWVYTPIEEYRKKFYIIPCSEYENKAYFFSDSVQYGKMKTFLKESRSLLYRQNTAFPEMIYNGSAWLLNR